MADSPQQQQQQTPPANQTPQSQQTPPASDDVEGNYWKRFEETVNKVVDDRLKALRPVAQQRTGRSTFRDLLADFMGGPFAPPKDNTKQ